jgi:hypothetical protein
MIEQQESIRTLKTIRQVNSIRQKAVVIVAAPSSRQRHPSVLIRPLQPRRMLAGGVPPRMIQS